MPEINEFGEIVNLGGVDAPQTQEDLLRRELSELQYVIFNNHRNPDKSPEKLARYKELQKILGVDLEQGDKVAALKRAQLKMRAKASGKPTVLDIIKQSNMQKE